MLYRGLGELFNVARRYTLPVLASLFLAGVSYAGKPADPVDQEMLTITEGYAQLEGGDSFAALELFSSAIEGNPRSLPAKMGRAMAYAKMRDHTSAFHAYDDIVQTNSRNAFAWNGRGLAAFSLGEFDIALRSFQEATADQPRNGFFYESLARVLMCLGEFEHAAEEAKTATLMYNQKGESSAYPLLIAYFSYLESGKRAEALRTLQYALRNKPAQNPWPYPVFDYLARQIQPSDLIAQVTQKSHETEAHTYIGLNLRLLGKEERATKHLGWVTARGDERVFEYILARAITGSDRATAQLN